MKSSKYPDNVYTEKLQISAIDMTRIDLAQLEEPFWFFQLRKPATKDLLRK